MAMSVNAHQQIAQIAEDLHNIQGHYCIMDTALFHGVFADQILFGLVSNSDVSNPSLQTLGHRVFVTSTRNPSANPNVKVIILNQLALQIIADLSQFARSFCGCTEPMPFELLEIKNNESLVLIHNAGGKLSHQWSQLSTIAAFLIPLRDAGFNCRLDILPSRNEGKFIFNFLPLRREFDQCCTHILNRVSIDAMTIADPNSPSLSDYEDHISRNINIDLNSCPINEYRVNYWLQHKVFHCSLWALPAPTEQFRQFRAVHQPGKLTLVHYSNAATYILETIGSYPFTNKSCHCGDSDNYFYVTCTQETVFYTAEHIHRELATGLLHGYPFVVEQEGQELKFIFAPPI